MDDKEVDQAKNITQALRRKSTKVSGGISIDNEATGTTILFQSKTAYVLICHSNGFRKLLMDCIDNRLSEASPLSFSQNSTCAKVHLEGTFTTNDNRIHTRRWSGIIRKNHF
jgi:hypothetical protein